MGSDKLRLAGTALPDLNALIAAAGGRQKVAKRMAVINGRMDPSKEEIEAQAKRLRRIVVNEGATIKTIDLLASAIDKSLPELLRLFEQAAGPPRATARARQRGVRRRKRAKSVLLRPSVPRLISAERKPTRRDKQLLLGFDIEYPETIDRMDKVNISCIFTNMGTRTESIRNIALVEILVQDDVSPLGSETLEHFESAAEVIMAGDRENDAHVVHIKATPYDYFYLRPSEITANDSQITDPIEIKPRGASVITIRVNLRSRNKKAANILLLGVRFEVLTDIGIFVNRICPAFQHVVGPSETMCGPLSREPFGVLPGYGEDAICPSLWDRLRTPAK